MTALLMVILVMVSLVLTSISAITFRWMMHAWHTPQNFQNANFSPASTPQLFFSLIMPARDEPFAVMSATLDRLVNQTHPYLEIIISVGHDDPNTVNHAHALAAQYPNVHVSVDTHKVKNKPRQLNTALTMCRGDVVGIVDAESIVAHELLERVDATFAARGVDVVQGAVHLVNYRARWWTLRNVMEYRVYFRSRLHHHARSGFIPLGGNTVFVYRTLLEQVSGWDPNCLAEDCDLGVRLSVLGRSVACVYDPDLVTREEAPETLKSFIGQRTRWSLGFMQVLGKGDWKQLPTRRQRLGAWWTLVQQYAMAFTGVVLPLSVVSVLFFKVPTGIALLTYLPLVPAIMTTGFELFLLHEFGRHMRVPIGPRDYLKLVLTTPFYQALLAFSALNAFRKYLRQDFAWTKTQHTGAHLEMVP